MEKNSGGGAAFRSGFVSITGRPNAGKSTLLNRVLGEKIAAVSPKPQTTRTRIMGVLTDEGAQIVFLDTPGLHKPKNKLGKYMVREARQGAGESDVTLYLVDASSCNVEAELEMIKSLDASTLFLVVNKTDKVEKSAILPLIATLSGAAEFAEVFPISAATGDGVGSLVETIVKYLPEGPKFFPDDTLTDQPERQICSELIREKMMRYLDEEIPYGTAVMIEKMTYDEGRAITSVNAVIYCERESHKSIIIGKSGAMLKKIGINARQDIQRFTGTKVFLELWVKVSKNWRNDEARLKNFGYDG